MKINYKEKTLMSQEETSKKDVQFMVESTKLQLQSDILATRKSLRESEEKLADLKTDYPLDTKKIIDAELEVEGYKNGLSRLLSLQSELGLK